MNPVAGLRWFWFNWHCGNCCSNWEDLEESTFNFEWKLIPFEHFEWFEHIEHIPEWHFYIKEWNLETSLQEVYP